MPFWRCGVQRPFRVFFHQPLLPSRATASQLPLVTPVEEEHTPYYDPDHFYPARLGQVLNERYQLRTKLGYGTGSTVWLAQDLRRFAMPSLCNLDGANVRSWRWSEKRYVAIKIASSRLASHATTTEHECSVLQQIASANPDHQGWRFVRHLTDSFTIPGKKGKHVCMVFEPLREPLWLYARRFVDGVIPPEILRIMIQMILEGLDYLHSECHLIHTDLKPDNIMVKVEDPSILDRDASDEYENPLPQKQIGDRIIYLSRNNYGRLVKPDGVIQITDFDRTFPGDVLQFGAIQAEIYRAPEVVLGTGYSYPADVWSLGVLLWDLLEGKALFNDAFDRKTQEINEDKYLAMITALIGPPPSVLMKGKRSDMFYKHEGTPKKPSALPVNFSFESTLSQVSGREKEMFIDFVKKMIAWDPQERSTAKELLKDPWLNENFEQS